MAAANLSAGLDIDWPTEESSLKLLSGRFVNETLTLHEENGLLYVSFPEAGRLQSSMIEISGASIVERLENYLAVVMPDNPRVISVWQIRSGKATRTNLEAQFYHPILAVLSWKKPDQGRLVVCFKDSLLILDSPSLQVIREIPEEGAEPAVLASCAATGHFGYAIGSSCGHIRIDNALSKFKAVDILAHDSPIAALTFSHSGDKVATASAKGTLIRVFGIQGQKLHEFRRGIKRLVAVSCLSFCKNDEFLTLASDSETIHIFKIETPDDDSWTSYFSKLAWSAVPAEMNVGQDRSFARAKLPSETGKVCSIVYIDQKPNLVVADWKGVIRIFDLPETEEQEGRCTLLCRHRLSVDGVSELSERTKDRVISVPRAPSVVETVSTDYEKWKKGLKESKARPYTSTDWSPGGSLKTKASPKTGS